MQKDRKEKIKFVLKITGVTTFLLFIIFSYLVEKGHLLNIDIFFNTYFGNRYKELFFVYSKILEYLYIFLFFLAIWLLRYFYKKGEKLEALLLLITGSTSFFAQFFVKPIFNVLCPGSYYNSVHTTYKLLFEIDFVQKLAMNETCYPSNHTIGYIVSCGYLALLLKTYFEKKRETNVLIFILLFVVASVGFTRVYLRVHWFSDVVAGYFLGFTFLSLIFWLRLHRREFRFFLKKTYEKLEKIKK